MNTMRAWDIAKLLLENCDSPREVDELITALENPNMVRDLRLKLLPWSETSSSESSADIDDASVPPTHVISSGAETPANTFESPDSQDFAFQSTGMRTTSPEELETILRSVGMTNKQSEQWILANFEVDIPIGKGSLRGYLARLIGDASPELTARILATARQLASDYSSRGSEEDKLKPIMGHPAVQRATEQVTLSSSEHRASELLSRQEARATEENSMATTAERLAGLLRSHGMTNLDVEHWVVSRFGVDIKVGKSSLHSYLTRLLVQSDLALRNRILVAAQRLNSEDPASTSDIQRHWDQLDRRFSSVE